MSPALATVQNHKSDGGRLVSTDGRTLPLKGAELRRGRRIALIGESGAGKSSVPTPRAASPASSSPRPSRTRSNAAWAAAVTRRDRRSLAGGAELTGAKDAKR